MCRSPSSFRSFSPIVDGFVFFFEIFARLNTPPPASRWIRSVVDGFVQILGGSVRFCTGSSDLVCSRRPVSDGTFNKRGITDSFPNLDSRQ